MSNLCEFWYLLCLFPQESVGTIFLVTYQVSFSGLWHRQLKIIFIVNRNSALQVRYFCKINYKKKSAAKSRLCEISRISQWLGTYLDVGLCSSKIISGLSWSASLWSNHRSLPPSSPFCPILGELQSEGFRCIGHGIRKPSWKWGGSFMQWFILAGWKPEHWLAEGCD